MLDFILTAPGAAYGPIQRLEAGTYQLTLMCDGIGPRTSFALQTLKDGQWQDIQAPPLVPGYQTTTVDVPAGPVRLDVRGRRNVEIFACLHKA